MLFANPSGKTNPILVHATNPNENALRVSVVIPGKPDDFFVVQPQRSNSFQIDPLVANGGPGLTIHDLTIRLLADGGNVQITVFDVQQSGSSAHALLPDDKLGYAYYALAAKPNGGMTNPSVFSAIAVQDDTEITFEIKLTADVEFYYRKTGSTVAELFSAAPGQNILTIKLNKGQTAVFQPVSANTDVTGIKMTSKKKFGAFTASFQHGVMTSTMPSMEHVGTDYIIVSIPRKTNYGYLIQATQDNTNTNRALSIFMNAGDTYPVNGLPTVTADATYITSSLTAKKPIVVAQYVLGSTGSTTSASSMILIPPISQYSSIYRFSVPPLSANLKTYILVAITSGQQGDLLVDGRTVTGVTWTAVPDRTSMVTGHIELLRGGYSRIQHKNPSVNFLAYLYTEGENGGMLYNAGPCLNTVFQVYTHTMFVLFTHDSHVAAFMFLLN